MKPMSETLRPKRQQMGKRGESICWELDELQAGDYQKDDGKRIRFHCELRVCQGGE